MEDKVYVYHETEVILTVRTATKPLRNEKIDTIHEITPADKENGSWKKWVRIKELHEISQ